MGDEDGNGDHFGGFGWGDFIEFQVVTPIEVEFDEGKEGGEGRGLFFDFMRESLGEIGEGGERGDGGNFFGIRGGKLDCDSSSLGETKGSPLGG